MKIIFIRHSERYDRTYPLHWMCSVASGAYMFDTPLSTNGVTMASDKATELIQAGHQINTIYTSPYLRTMTTAMTITESYPEANVIINRNISEYQSHFSHATNICPNNISHVYPESHDDMVSRISLFLDTTVESHQEDDEILVVTHSEIVKTLGDILSELTDDFEFDGHVPYLARLELHITDSNITNVYFHK